jgi:rRNA-processing protein FCF1
VHRIQSEKIKRKKEKQNQRSRFHKSAQPSQPHQHEADKQHQDEIKHDDAVHDDARDASAAILAPNDNELTSFNADNDGERCECERSGAYEE